MTKKEFIDRLTYLVKEYLANADSFDGNAQLVVEPDGMSITVINGADMLNIIDASDEAIEAAAGAERPEYEDDDDFQASRIPDFFAMSALIESDGKTPSANAIEQAAEKYFA